MASPNRAVPESMVDQFYDLDAVTTTLTAWAPKAGHSMARGFIVVTSGTLVVTGAGTADTPGSQQTIPAAAMIAGARWPLAMTAIGAASTATVLPYY
jgi:hypothetical protein